MMKKISLLCLFVFLASSFSDDTIQKKRIRNEDYNFLFYVSLKSKKTKKNRPYYWYKSGEIHQSFGDAGGELLHSEYTKYYNSNELAEKGKFNYGLKTGTWKSWYRNGALKTVQKWKNGNLSGRSLFFDEQGALLQEGRYSRGRKTGTWINHEKKDTVQFRKGKIYIKENKGDSVSGKRPPFYKRIFMKKDKKVEGENSKSKKSVKAKPSPKKESFLKRIFRKKKSKKNAKG